MNVPSIDFEKLNYITLMIMIINIRIIFIAYTMQRRCRSSLYGVREVNRDRFGMLCGHNAAKENVLVVFWS